MSHICLILFPIVFLQVLTSAFFIKRDLDGTGCSNGKCSVIINVLHDPRLIAAWTTKAQTWDKALTQMHAYQQLFASENEELANDLSEKTIQTPLKEKHDAESSRIRSKRSFMAPAKIRPSKEDNIYWLIRITGK